jgi:hypothetical protein
MITSSKRYNMHTRYNLLVDFYWDVMKEKWRWLTNKFRYFIFVYRPWFYYCRGQGGKCVYWAVEIQTITTVF